MKNCKIEVSIKVTCEPSWHETQTVSEVNLATKAEYALPELGPLLTDRIREATELAQDRLGRFVAEESIRIQRENEAKREREALTS